MTDNVATQQGYTDEVIAIGDAFDMALLVRPDADLDGRFRAWDMDGQEFVAVNGWMFEFEIVETAE